MPHYDLIIRRGTLVTPGGIAASDLAVDGGRIVALAPEIAGAGREEITAAGLHVFPGLIDAHVHCNEPGRTEWEGFATATRALAAGGATAFFDMPLNAHPPTLDVASFDAKRAAAENAALIDFALWGGLTPLNLDHLDELAARGVVGFKAFMSSSGIEDFPAADDATLVRGMERAARLGRIVAVHAEDEAITSRLAQEAQAEGRTSVRDYLRSRPVRAELEAIARAIGYAEAAGCALHIVHVSCGQGVRLVAEARARGVDVSCETCPHYLVLTEEDVEALGAVAKCAPPLRSRAELEALWAHLLDGSLPMVASDHSPAPASMKADANFFKVWGGISGCQSTLPLLLTEGHVRRGLPLTAIAAATAQYVARRFHVPHKGALAEGCDADLALVDLRAAEELQADDLLYRHRHSPYVGRALRGRVVRTLVRGLTVYRNRAVVSAPVGRLVRPGPQPFAA
ncbi:MAG TPA: allantoinase [Roseiflexaceae bacterium]|nr:allantoinase [Roseiflexaceae bacterium]